MTPIQLASVVLISLHNIDGDEIMINVDQVVTLVHTREGGAHGGGPNSLITKGAKCVIGLANGKFVSVTEDCGMVRQALREAR